MGHKCFISFKTEDVIFKEKIQTELNIDMIDKSLNQPINSEDEDYIMKKIREDHLADSTITIFLIGTKSAEESKENEYIKRELQASLYSGKNNSKNGILGVVLPSMYNTIFLGEAHCSECNGIHNIVKLNDTTCIREFWKNYYIEPKKCAWKKDDRYCVLVKWSSFKNNPQKYIDQAFEKRSQPIAKKTTVKP